MIYNSRIQLFRQTINTKKKKNTEKLNKGANLFISTKKLFYKLEFFKIIKTEL